jgi:dipeptidyl-peptidase-4
VQHTAGPYDYITRADWLPDGGGIALTWLNRDQNELEVLFSDLDGKTRTVLRESVQNGWLRGTRQPHFLPDGKTFLWLSEKDGFNHIYRYDYQGRCLGQLTHGEWDVIGIAGADRKRLFFTAARERRESTHLYSVSVTGKKLRKLTQKHGTHRIFMHPAATCYLSTFCRFDTPDRQRLYDADGRFVADISPDSPARHELPRIEFFRLNTPDGVLNAFIIKPVNFDAAKKYPLLVRTYAGPESRSVSDRWSGRMTFWYDYLSRRDILIAAIDGRGTAHCGRDWKHAVYRRLGDVEIADQIAGVKALTTLGYIDSSRVGIIGQSYGGYSAIMCLLKGASLFKIGVAISPVTDWRNYDAIYSERYMGHPMENEDGYNEASAINHAKKLKAKLLLIHGSADDNVHLANTMQLAGALQCHRLDFDLMIYPRRKHGIDGTDARIHMYNKITDFILTNL